MMAWEYREPQCEERLGVVASSTVTSIRRLKPQKRPGNGMQEYAGALAIMVNSTEQRASGVVISDERHLCLEHCFLTNVPQLLICIGGEDEIEKLDRIENRLLDSTTISRINAQTQGNLLQISSKLEIVSLSRMLHTKICDLDARATRQDFAQLLNGPSPYALQGLATGMDDYPSFGHNETAYTVSIRGSTAYFALCPPEQVQLVALPKCSLQVPVVRSDGTLAFVDPINRHLVDIPTWVECDSGLPVRQYNRHLSRKNSPNSLATISGQSTRSQGGRSASSRPHDDQLQANTDDLRDHQRAGVWENHTKQDCPSHDREH